MENDSGMSEGKKHFVKVKHNIPPPYSNSVMNIEYVRGGRVYERMLMQILLDALRIKKDDIDDNLYPIFPIERGVYLFSWDDIPGNDNGRLIEFIKKRFGIDWVETAKIEKIDNFRTIKLSFKDNFISLKLNDESTRINLNIDDGRTDEFTTKIENDKLNIYRKGKQGGYLKPDLYLKEKNVYIEVTTWGDSNMIFSKIMQGYLLKQKRSGSRYYVVIAGLNIENGWTWDDMEYWKKWSIIGDVQAVDGWFGFKNIDVLVEEIREAPLVV